MALLAAHKSIESNLLRHFMAQQQLAVLAEARRGEEGEFFDQKLAEISAVIRSMPKTYETDGQGDAAIAHLHYFKGGCDWFITEKDMGDESGDLAQHQAFGLAKMGGDPELGYISIRELIELGVELDLYFTPAPLSECRAALQCKGQHAPG